MAARNARATLCLVPGAGHAVPLERAAGCAQELERFLERSIDA
jgi:pimeloyl-ACP methyl ester carboxylesterase